jgi:ABC-type transport system involved in cytochrome c biogenesis permease subunit
VSEIEPMLSLVALSLSLTFVGTPQASPAVYPATLDFDVIRGLVVQHDGRYPPLDTVARDVLTEVTGSDDVDGQDPVAVLLAWTFDPQASMATPLIRISNAELRKELELPAEKTVYSYRELMSHGPLQSQIAGLARVVDGQKLDPLQKKVSGIESKLGMLQSVFHGVVIKPVPNPDDVGGAWRPIVSLGGASAVDQQTRKIWTDLRTAFLADDAPSFSAASNQLVTAMKALPAAFTPSPDRIANELLSNRLHPFRNAWIAMLIGTALSAAAVFIRRRWFDVLAVLGLLSGFGLLTYGMWLRWQIAGRIPASNMFESLLFVSWGVGAFAVVSMLVIRHRTVPLTAAAMGALSLMLADCLPLDSFVRPIAPVLADTVWMSIHVPVIMVSYSVLTLAVLVAHVQLVVMAVAPKRADLTRSIDSMHYWYVHVGSILLFAGIVTGSMWAASSWGRSWGWDPKEVWSLVAFLGYMTILHVKISTERVPKWAYVVAGIMLVCLSIVILPYFQPISGMKVLALVGTFAAIALFVLACGEMAAALKSIVAFWLILMTYVGVNYILGMGLHSYGFGTNNAARHMITAGVIDLSFIGVCCITYLIRTRSHTLSAPHLPIAAGA